MRQRLATAYLRAQWSIQQRERPGRLQELMATFTQRGAEMVQAVGSAIVGAAGITAMAAAALVISPLAAIVAAGAGVLLTMGQRPLRTGITRRASEAADAGVDFTTGIAEAATVALEHHVFDVHEEAERRLHDLISANERAHERLLFLRTIGPVVFVSLAYASIIVAVGVAVGLELGDVGATGAAVLVMLRSLGYAQMLQGAWSSVAASVPFVDAYEQQLAEYRAHEASRGAVAGSDVRHVVLDRVSFRHEGGPLVLDDVSASFRRGELVGIVGPSGAGKSTLVELLLGVRQPTTGRILVDGVDLVALRREDIAREISYVPQECRLIAGSVAENVRFFRRHITDDQVKWAIERAGLGAAVRQWPAGLDHPVGELGSGLSGGQRQRIALARAIAGRPSVLLLDEVTSALDAETERGVTESLVGLRDRMAIVIVAHRLSTVTACDRILVVEDGQIRADERPEVLAEIDGFYRRALALSGGDAG
jgi:ABC-type multidrug transport system fused ATPase/permease subunit